jgi:hypothetical protein
VQQNSAQRAFRTSSNPAIRRQTTRIARTIRQTIPMDQILQVMDQPSRGAQRTKKIRPKRIRIQTAQTVRITQPRRVGRITLRPRRILTTRHHQMARIIRLLRAGQIIKILRADRTIQILQAGHHPRHPVPPAAGRDKINFLIERQRKWAVFECLFRAGNFNYIATSLFQQPQFQVKEQKFNRQSPASTASVSGSLRSTQQRPVQTFSENHACYRWSTSLRYQRDSQPRQCKLRVVASRACSEIRKIVASADSRRTLRLAQEKR